MSGAKIAGGLKRNSLQKKLKRHWVERWQKSNKLHYIMWIANFIYFVHNALFHSWEVWKLSFFSINRAVSITLHQCNKQNKNILSKDIVQNASSFFSFFLLSKTISAMTYTWHFSFAILSECIIDKQHVTCTVGMDLRGFSTKDRRKTICSK